MKSSDGFLSILGRLFYFFPYRLPNWQRLNGNSMHLSEEHDELEPSPSGYPTDRSLGRPGKAHFDAFMRKLLKHRIHFFNPYSWFNYRVISLTNKNSKKNFFAPVEVTELERDCTTGSLGRWLHCSLLFDSLSWFEPGLFLRKSLLVLLSVCIFIINSFPEQNHLHFDLCNLC